MNLLKLYKESSVLEKITLFSFIAFIFITSLCNRLSIDDLFFKYRIDVVGLTGIIDSLYSRILAYFLNGCIIAADNRLVYIAYNLVSIFVFAYYLLKVTTHITKYYTPNNSVQQKFTLLFFLFVFFCCSGHAELFFWYTQVSTYLWCISSLLIVTHYLISGFDNKWQMVLFLAACIFAGSSSEFLAVQFMLLLAFCILRKKIIFFGSPFTKLFIPGILLIMFGLVITFTSPGISARDGILPENYSIDASINATYLSLHYFYHFLKWPQLAYLILFMVAFAILGSSTKSVFRLSLSEIILFLAFIFGSLFFVNLRLNDLTPPRSLIICDLIGLFPLAKASMQAGRYIGTRIHILPFFKIPLLLLLNTVWVLYSLQAFQYAGAYDEREKIVQTSAVDPIVVKPLPGMYFLYACNISADSLDFRNQHLKLSHHLKANIICKEP